VGSLVVLDDSRVVGIVTANDFFYKVVNPILCLDMDGHCLPGIQVEIPEGCEGKAMEEIISTVNKLGITVGNLHMFTPEGSTKKNLILHCSGCEEDMERKLVSELKNKGYSASTRRPPCQTFVC